MGFPLLPQCDGVYPVVKDGAGRADVVPGLAPLRPGRAEKLLTLDPAGV